MKQSVRSVSLLLIVFAFVSPQLTIAAKPPQSAPFPSKSAPSPKLNLSETTPTPTNPASAKTPDDSHAQTLRLEIRLSQRQVTLYQGKSKVKSYAIAVGRPGWDTPTGSFKVKEMIKNPAWVHPFKGITIPGGDPENPLGRYWIGFWTDGKNWIGFHGTPTPQSVGTAASHGCIRMYNKDVEELFQKVSLGTVVTVVK